MQFIMRLKHIKIKEEKFIRDHKEESQKRIDDFNAYWEKMEELRKK